MSQDIIDKLLEKLGYKKIQLYQTYLAEIARKIIYQNYTVGSNLTQNYTLYIYSNPILSEEKDVIVFALCDFSKIVDLTRETQETVYAGHYNYIYVKRDKNKITIKTEKIENGLENTILEIVFNE